MIMSHQIESINKETEVIFLKDQMDPIKKVKRKPSERGKTSSAQISGKGTESRIKNFYCSIIRRQLIHLKMGKGSSKNSSPRKTCK